MSVNNYFGVGKDVEHVFPFDDGDPNEAIRAYAQASEARRVNPEKLRVRVYRASAPYIRDLCDAVVGVSR